MTYKIYTVNNNGLKQIKDILTKNHANFQNREPTHSELSAWASDVEDSLNNGNGACFEILNWSTVAGGTKEFTITSEGYDAEEVNED